MIDSHAHLAEFRRRDLEAAAAEFRLGRGPARSPLARLYARIWWASRPRAGSWVPDGPARWTTHAAAGTTVIGQTRPTLLDPSF